MRRARSSWCISSSEAPVLSRISIRCGSHLRSCHYGMNFQHGVNLKLSIETGDNFIGATLSSILNAAITVRKMTAPEIEKQALATTSVRSVSGNLEIEFATSDEEFAGLLKSSLFQSVLA